MVSIVTEPECATVDWLSEVLRIRVKETRTHEPIGTGQKVREQVKVRRDAAEPALVREEAPQIGRGFPSANG